MEVKRNIIVALRNWRNKSTRKPLILRGARQVGKTTLINSFAKEFEYFISLNLEKDDDKKHFIDAKNTNDLISTIFFAHNIKKEAKDVLLFIDEIQETPEAINWLRYFYEEYPHIHIIAAGSLLESIFNTKFPFPVGRVEYLVLRPFSFEEFLIALDEQQVLEAYHTIPFPDYAYAKTLKLFNTYTLIGGMPEIVVNYAKKKDVKELDNLYISLLTSYIDDVEKYARNNTLTQVIRLCIRAAFNEAGTRIKFTKFGNTNYKSREIGEALRSLEKTYILSLVYPHTNFDLPIIPNYRKSPRLQVFDTGLYNYFSGLQKEIFHLDNLQNNPKGKITEHIVGQELLANNYSALGATHFWVREKNNADAEVDFILPFNGQLIPIEVKSGATGRLRSLHYYMQFSKAQISIRLYAGKILQQNVEIKGTKKYNLLHLPYFLSGKIESYLAYYK